MSKGCNFPKSHREKACRGKPGFAPTSVGLLSVWMEWDTLIVDWVFSLMSCSQPVLLVEGAMHGPSALCLVLHSPSWLLFLKQPWSVHIFILQGGSNHLFLSWGSHLLLDTGGEWGTYWRRGSDEKTGRTPWASSWPLHRFLVGWALTALPSLLRSWRTDL